MTLQTSCVTALSANESAAEAHELFIYYRAERRHHAELCIAVGRMQAQLRQCHPGLAARLLLRASDADETQTWMEAYVLPTRADAAAVAAAIEHAATQLHALIRGPRHVEHFIACAS